MHITLSRYYAYVINLQHADKIGYTQNAAPKFKMTNVRCWPEAEVNPGNLNDR
jgi:hypothetical protein